MLGELSGAPASGETASDWVVSEDLFPNRGSAASIIALLPQRGGKDSGEGYKPQ